MARKSQIKNERIAIYFDLICGVTSSVIALIGIIFVVISNRVTRIGWLITGFTFWMGYFLFSVFMISYGLYINYKSKNFDPSKYKKDLRAPIV